MPTREIQVASIVVVGSFNPAIFQPFWFAKHGLIRDEEAEGVSLEVIHNAATSFSTTWFALRVDQNRLSFESADPTKLLVLRDLVQGTFDLLEHIPIRAFGFNCNSHYKLENEAVWNAVGDKLVPKETWKTKLVKPGMAAVIVQGKREGCGANSVQIRVEPSAVPAVAPFGVSVHVNQHYAFDNVTVGAKPSEPRFVAGLAKDWSDFLSYSQQVSNELAENK